MSVTSSASIGNVSLSGDEILGLDLPTGEHRQRAVILAYSRRNVTVGEPIELLRNAATLIAATLQIPLRGTVEICASSDQLHLEIMGRAMTERPIEHNYSLEPCNSLAAYVVYEGRVISSANFHEETGFRDLFLRRAGINSGMMLPVGFDDEILGAIGIFCRQHHEFSVADVEFAETISHLLMASLARLAGARQLEQAQGTLSTLLDTTEAIVILTDLQGRILRTNQACQRLTGYRVDELAERLLWNTLVTPEELSLFRGKFREASQSAEPVTFESDLLGKHGQHYRVRWTQGPLHEAGFSNRSMILSGVDISAQTQLEAEIKSLRQVRQQVQRQLATVLEQIEHPSPRTVPASSTLPPAADSPPALQKSPGKPAAIAIPTRRAYPYRQMVASVVGERLPSPDQFAAVQFREISADGVSFVMPERPTFDIVVLALGCPPLVHYVRAQVIEAVEIASEQPTIYLVRCRFLERVDL